MSERQTAPGEGVTTIDGLRLRNLMQAGLAWLEVNYEHVNSLNVFPVPDGDTGTNMLLTMRSAWNEINKSEDQHAGKVAQAVYNGALMGARGNSGVILSQLLRGFAHGVEDEPELSVDAVRRGFEEASRTAYQAVQEPVEGTMLTVAREIAEEANAAAGDTDELLPFLERITERAKVSVQRTPELLDVLREAGVVDSGGTGMLYILEGMLRHAKGEPLELAEAVAGDTLRSTLDPEDEEGYGYDVQFLVRGEDFDVPTIRQTIESMGWSTLVVGDESLVKVHVHVHNPGEVLGYAADLGPIDDIVVENMQAQYETFVKQRGGDAGEGQPDVEAPEIEAGTIATVTVAPGDGLKRIFYSLGAGHVVAGGQTMNPSTKDLLDAVEDLPTDRVIILPNNKNIIMAAEQAAEKANSKDVRVVTTRTIPQGISALLALDPHGDLDDVIASMEDFAAMVETGEVTTSTRDVTLNGVAVKEGQIIGLHNDKLAIAGQDVNSVVLDLLKEMDTEDFELITLYYGEDIDPGQAHTLVEHLQEVYPDHEIELRDGGQAHYFYILSVE